MLLPQLMLKVKDPQRFIKSKISSLQLPVYFHAAHRVLHFVECKTLYKYTDLVKVPKIDAFVFINFYFTRPF
jgi:hypothetical protein